MLPAISRIKAAPSAAACSSDRGGTSRVLTSPIRGALAITATAQASLNGGNAASSVPASPGTRDGGDQFERGVRAVRLALFEIAGLDRHLVGDVRQAQYRPVARPGEGIERRRLHLDRENA